MERGYKQSMLVTCICVLGTCGQAMGFGLATGFLARRTVLYGAGMLGGAVLASKAGEPSQSGADQRVASKFGFGKPGIFKPTAATPKIPVVYHPCYNLSLFFGLERLIHPFDGAKYGKIAEHICKTFGLSSTAFHEPKMVSDEQLQTVHTVPYLESKVTPSV